ncbi:MAG: uracil-DNA glycosylase [Phycisphaerae bacterium]
MSPRDRSERLASLHRGICRCRKCPLHESRTHAVPGEGDTRAVAMMIGEAPGEKEDLQARPFCGRSGNFLDKVFVDLDMRREDFYITSTVKCRPPNNRTPAEREAATCREAWLSRQIECIRPRVIVLLGLTAIRCVLGEKVKLADVHGELREVDGTTCLLTYHPTSAMRFPTSEKRFRGDLRKLSDLL